jgi:putative ubiquitin-RnfH superfamily antitoxin RatB of RatAB toxin-antitoxin module
MKTCTVVFALPERQWSWRVELPDDATVGAALEAARAVAGTPGVPWDGAVGIFGALCNRNVVPREGDRIEIYRSLKADPKASRRARAKDRALGPGRAAAGPRPRRNS